MLRTGILTVIATALLSCRPPAAVVVDAEAIVRSQPLLSGKEIARIGQGEAVSIIEEQDSVVTVEGRSGKWLLIRYTNSQGMGMDAWVFSAALLQGDDQMVAFRKCLRENSVAKERCREFK